MIFTKMHGCGNDYVYFDCLNDFSGETQARIIPSIERLSDRHFGIGGDGVVLICPSSVADAKMRMFNADGSEGKMCGNASRCVAKYLFDNGYVKSDEVSLETLSGVKPIKLRIVDNEVVGATVNMGAPITAAANIPVDKSRLLDGGIDANGVLAATIEVDEKQYVITAVSMGNPHCVVFTDTPVTKIKLDEIGPKFENHPAFPERVNVEFVNVTGDNALSMRVWERGSGETLACGTGSCAVAVAATLNKLCKPEKPVKIKLLGGSLTVRVQKDGVYMCGPATTVFSGTVNL